MSKREKVLKEKKLVDLTNEEQSRKFFEDKIADLVTNHQTVINDVLNAISETYLNGFKEGYDKGYDDGLGEGFKSLGGHYKYSRED